MMGNHAQALTSECPKVRREQRPLHRHDGAEADDGEAGAATDPPGLEEHDEGGGRGPGLPAQLQRGEGCPRTRTSVGRSVGRF